MAVFWVRISNSEDRVAGFGAGPFIRCFGRFGFGGGGLCPYQDGKRPGERMTPVERPCCKGCSWAAWKVRACGWWSPIDRAVARHSQPPLCRETTHRQNRLSSKAVNLAHHAPHLDTVSIVARIHAINGSQVSSPWSAEYLGRRLRAAASSAGALAKSAPPLLPFRIAHSIPPGSFGPSG